MPTEDEDAATPPVGKFPVASAALPPPRTILEPPVLEGAEQLAMVFMHEVKICNDPTLSPFESAHREIPPSSGLEEPGV
jgi:hypothetical protein